MDQLTQRENELRYFLPVGIQLKSARAALRGQGIYFVEAVVSEPRSVFSRNGMGIIAQPGEVLIAASGIRMDAWKFPCGYSIKLD